MQNTPENSVKIAVKWAAIYLLVSIILTYIYQFTNIDVSSPVKYISYLPFIGFLLLTQKEYRDQLGGFMPFGKGFVAGLLYAVFAGLMLAVFTFIYFKFLSPQAYEQMLSSMEAKLGESGSLSAETIEGTMSIWKKYGIIITTAGILIGTPITGTIISLIGAAIFKKEPTLQDIERRAAENETELKR